MLMYASRRDDEFDVLDRLRALYFWVFVFGVVAGLWMYADARSRMARRPDVRPPPRWPIHQSAWRSRRPLKPPAPDAFTAIEAAPEHSD